MALLSTLVPGPVGSPFGWWCRALFVLLLPALTIATTMRGQAPVTQEYVVKAVFLFNFAQFVEWPSSAFSDPAAPIVIGIWGNDPFGARLDEVVAGEMVGQRPLEVLRCRSVEEALTCHILFITSTGAPWLEQIDHRLRGRSILTVSDDEGPRSRGVMIRFAPVNKRLKLRINLEATKAAGLTISSKLLRSAEIVNGGAR